MTQTELLQYLGNRAREHAVKVAALKKAWTAFDDANPLLWGTPGWVEIRRAIEAL